MKKISCLLIVLILVITGCSKKQSISEEGDQFTFAFLTDIHLTTERNAVEGFRKAIDTINKLNPDFVLTGGDLVMDALGQTYGKADSLYNLYLKEIEAFNMPVYNTMGNHEIFAWHRDDQEFTGHEEFGKRMFEKKIGERYYSFDHKGWHFIVLDGMSRRESGEYFGRIDDEQIEWLKNDLENTDKETPIAISIHIPFITSQAQLMEGSLAQNSDWLVVTNSREVLLLFLDYNLKLVLQGHLHFLEDIYINNQVHFITGGAVSGRWWANKPESTPEEGFLLVKAKGGEIEWDYIDFGWVTEFEK
jgi:Icc protein